MFEFGTQVSATVTILLDTEVANVPPFFVVKERRQYLFNAFLYLFTCHVIRINYKGTLRRVIATELLMMAAEMRQKTD